MINGHAIPNDHRYIVLALYHALSHGTSGFSTYSYIHILCSCDFDLFISAPDNYIHARAHTVHFEFARKLVWQVGIAKIRNIITDTLLVVTDAAAAVDFFCSANRFLIITKT